MQQVLAARIDRLTADQKAALQLGSVLGREFPVGLAEDVWDGGVLLEDQLQELKGLEFLRERYGTPERAFVFAHALTREVAYDGMLEARRRELHGRAGDALEHAEDSHRFEHGELLGYHYSRSAEPRRAIPYLAAAGDRASARYANEEAVALYRRAIGLTEELDGDQPSDTYRVICESLGDALYRLSRYDEAIDAYNTGLAAATDPFQRARLHILCSDAEQLAHRYPEALARCDLAEQALGSAPAIPEPQWLSLWLDAQDVRMGVAYWLNDTAEMARLIDRARPVVEAYGSAGQRASFYFGVAQLSLRRGRYLVTSEALELMWAGHAAAQEVSPEPLWWAGFMVGVTLLWHGDLDQAAAMLEETLREAERRGEAEFRSRCVTYLMTVARKRGDVNGVREAVGPVIERAREASLPEYEATAVANRAWVAWRTGDEERAATDALAALDMWQALPVRYFYDWMALWPLVAMALAAGRVEEAAGHARGMLPPPQQLLREPARTLTENAVQAWDAGQPAEAEDLLRRALSAAADLGYL